MVSPAVDPIADAKGSFSAGYEPVHRAEYGYINSIESGKNFPTMKNFFYICEYLHITPKEFFEDGSADPETIRKMVENLKRLDGEQVDALSKIVEGLAK